MSPKMKGGFNVDELKNFIDLVKQHPPLYDPSAKTSSPQSTAIIWAKIAGEMGISSMQVADWKNKWKCLRDTFVKKRKDIRLAESQENVDKAIQWRFYSRMLFLDPFIDRGGYKTIPKNAGNNVVSEFEHYTIIKREDYEEGGVTTEEEGEEASYSDRKREADEISNSETTSPPKRRRQRNRNKNSTINNNNSITIVDDLDEDEMNMLNEEESNDSQCNSNAAAVEGSNSRSYFMSCAIRMDQLPVRVQSYLQLQISQLFFNAENPDVPPVPIMPLPLPPSS